MKYECLGVHCIYAKSSLSMLYKSKVEIFLLGTWQPDWGCASQPRWGTFVPKPPEIWTITATKTQLCP